MVDLTPEQKKHIALAELFIKQSEKAVRLEWWRNLIRLLVRPSWFIPWCILYASYWFIYSLYFIRYVLTFAVLIYLLSLVKGDFLFFPLFIYGGR